MGFSRFLDKTKKNEKLILSFHSIFIFFKKKKRYYYIDTNKFEEHF